MQTAVIGLGAIGGAVAKALAKSGVDVIVAARDQDKARQFAGDLAPRARAMSIHDAIEEADIVVMAIWLDAITALVATEGEALSGKIIVDPSNPIAPDGKGGFTKTIPEDQSSGVLIAERLPAGAKLVKAFGSLSASSLASAAHRTPDRAVLFYAADDPEAGDAVAELISASGFAPVRVGGIDQSIRIEVFGDLHEFGALGRLVSAAEAETMLASD